MPTPPNQLKKKGLISTKAIIIIAIVVIIGIGLMVFYLNYTLSNLEKGLPVATTGPLPPPQIAATLSKQELLSYYGITPPNANNEYPVPSRYIPYVLLNYTNHNISQININVSIFKYAQPMSIYIVNESDECFDCGNITAIDNYFISDLITYNIITNRSQINFVSPNQLNSVPDDSIIIILNGLLPGDLLRNVSYNTTVLDSLLNRHESIIYVGKSFDSGFLFGSTPEKRQLPAYLYTIPFTSYASKKNNSFYFDNASFMFPVPGTSTIQNYSIYVTYENVYNGSIVAFPNSPNSWKSANETGSDLAKAVKTLFWLPKYASGTRTITTTSRNSSGQVGVLLNSMIIPFNTNFSSKLDSNGSIRIAIKSNATYVLRNSNNTYSYIYTVPQLYYNGSIGMPAQVVTNDTADLNLTIYTGTNVTKQILPHIGVYTLNNTLLFSTPVSSTPLNVTNNISIFDPQNFVLPPGRSYIIRMFSYEGEEYAAALFNVSPVTLSLYAANWTSNQFKFQVTSDGKPLTNLNYYMTLNNAYPSSGTIKNGIIYYDGVPPQTPEISGTLNFKIVVSNSTFYYPPIIHNAIPFQLNSQYIVVGVVVVVMLIMIVFVRAPNRDEFYIDVPNLPEGKKVEIRLKASDIVEVFDKLNISYHWRYMPLSKTEIKAAIASNIKFNNIPVGLTYSNVERILDQLTVNNLLVTADNLYAPARWIDASKHDIDYLATFKKLRIYLVTHAYLFTDIDTSTNSDIVATLHNERKYIVIYSKTSNFQKVPIYANSKTYLVFLNSFKLEEFKNNLYASASQEAEELKMYIAADYITLVDADNPDGLLN
jgi:hypothetical protein